jgi:hypothetical protein
MEEDRTVDLVIDSVSRGDVETLIYIWRTREDLRSDIDSLVNSLAENLRLPSADTFKEFVVNVYDPYQAKLALEEGRALEYMQDGGMARTRNIAKLLTADNVSPEVLYYVLLKLNEQKNEDIMNLVKTVPGKQLKDIISSLNLLCRRNNNWIPYVAFLDYTLKAHPYLSNSLGIRDLPGFVTAFVKMFYPKYDFEKLTYGVRYFNGFMPVFYTEVTVKFINAITDYNELTNAEKENLLEALKKRAKLGYLTSWERRGIKDAYIRELLAQEKY